VEPLNKEVLIFKLQNTFHNRLLGFLLLSFIVHTVLLTLIDWKRIPPIPEEKIFEVELIKPSEKQLLKPPKATPLQPRKKTVQKKRSKERATLEQPIINKRSLTPPAATPNLKPTKPTLFLDSSLSDSLIENDADTLQLSKTVLSKQNLVKESEIDLSKNDLSQEITSQQKIPRKDTKANVPSAVLGIGAGQITSDAPEREIEAGFFQKYDENLKFRIIKGPVEQSKGDSSKSEGSEGAISIEGEAAKRKIIFIPKPPKLDLEKNVTVSLRFTVLPNGAIDQIFPFKKADPKLELLAIELLQQYRFEPLLDKQKLQTGIIHFTLQGRQ